MAHFSLEKDLNTALKMDAPLTRGPLPRWQRKTLQESANSTANSTVLECSLNSSSFNNTLPTGRSPFKPQAKGKTPNSKKTPKPANGGDRFIPNRGAMQFDKAYYLLTRGTSQENITQDTPAEKAYKDVVVDQLGTDLENFKIMAYQNKAPDAPEGHAGNKVLYSSSKQVISSKKNTRHIPQAPERILDAPDIVDDYYLNLLDWGCNNILGVGLANEVYLWQATNGEISQLINLPDPNVYISSLAFSGEGSYLAVGLSSNEVQLWDVEGMKLLRVMRGHTGRVGVLSWNSHVLSSGSRSSSIFHHDVRVAQHHVGTLQHHTQEVCGLKWSPDGRYLASGANDNLLNIWPATMSHGNRVRPVYSFAEHQSAVKAVAWCPWQSNLLASGGGTADRCIRFWNCNQGESINCINTGSQVCSILWSKEYKELISGHGFAKNELIIWKYPSLTKVAELTGHTARILQLAMSPNGDVIMSAGADETLRLWKCFAVDPSKHKTENKAIVKASILTQSIR